MEKNNTKTTRHEIYTTLFNRIIQNEYPVDTWLREDLLAREFNVSRSPVRSVLQNLEQDHLIEILPKRGARIFPFTADDLEDIYELRRELESLALRRAANSLSIQKLLEMKALILGLKDNVNFREHARVDGYLHSYLIQSSGRRRLIRMLDQLYRLTQTFRELSLEQQFSKDITIQEHIELIDALCIRDIDKASELLARHIENSKIRVLTLVIQGRMAEESSIRE
ncbi:GntR family transcriptional regulator [Marispirochaeta sp.]|jgi:GntR family transcriptional regulator, rspAB operon transcriptional repressor|uniref:GntR family transcriptional regulator n=1 Tax=Marispirochaeta sp. TaxID=2038653 RepID=UPI0029C94422|nr:GntR family transcriptional regulator [Marispirochaeta sp.]